MSTIIIFSFRYQLFIILLYVLVVLSSIITYQLTYFDVGCLKASLTVYCFQLCELFNQLSHEVDCVGSRPSQISVIF